MTTVLVLNGTPPSPERLRQLAAVHPVYAADGGAKACLAAGVKPVCVVGDFDSVRPEELPRDWECLHINDQESTDFEKLLRTLPPESTQLLILGAFSERMDHLLTNLLIANAMPERYSICLEGHRQSLTRVTPIRPFIGNLPLASTLSLLPLSPAAGVTTQGLRWNLNHASMGADLQLGQSNEVIGPVQVKITEGALFVWTGTPS